jgi:hypothetical protein
MICVKAPVANVFGGQISFDISENGIPDVHTFLKMVVEEREKETLDALSKIISILAKYPETDTCGIVARAYLGYGVVTIGFTDHLGDWDPAINFLISEVMDLPLEEIQKIVEIEFEGE